MGLKPVSAGQVSANVESCLMKTRFISLLAVLCVATALPAQAHDRYAERPPVMVSPDLTAPWVLQLRQHPVGVVSRDRNVTGVQVQPTYRRQHQIDEMRVAGVAAPAKRRVRPQMDPIYLPQDVAYSGGQKPGTIIIDTQQNFLYLVGKGGHARRYGVGTGKPGFEWAGTHKVTRKQVWPDWRPPSEMIRRERAKGRVLPAYMPGGPENPMGARALYLGSTLYRIHGTNQPWTIGGAVSSGCIRMRNEDVVDLYGRVRIGAKVIVR